VIDKEDIKWTRRGTFAPAAMSAKDGMIKIKSNLAKYLGRPESEELAKIEIMLTDWKKMQRDYSSRRKKLSKHKPSLTKEIYYPNDGRDISIWKNRSFPGEEAVDTLAYIRRWGYW
jgi:hypothetical protein